MPTNMQTDQGMNNASTPARSDYYRITTADDDDPSVDLFSLVLLLLAVLGALTNVASFFVFLKQRFRRNFHRLLMILAVYDFMVVVFCALMYSLPSLWPAYALHTHPALAPFLLPLVHIALMSSVYCTIVLSWERYLRICLGSNNLAGCNCFSKAIQGCQYVAFECSQAKLAGNPVWQGKFKCYVAFIVIFPVIFYLPKFFELQSSHFTQQYLLTVDCALANASSSRLGVFNEDDQIPECSAVLGKIKEVQRVYDDSLLLNVTREEKVLGVFTTWLRRDPLYYNLYCIVLNTVFATLVPLAMLSYFNVSTVMALRSLDMLKAGSINSHGDRRSDIPRTYCQTHQVQRHKPDTSRAPAEPRGSYSNPSHRVSHRLRTPDPAVPPGPGDPVGPTGPSRPVVPRSPQGPAGKPMLRHSTSPVCRRRENRLTRISLAIVWLFLFCHAWKLVPTAYEAFVGDIESGPAWLAHVQHMSHFLIVLNSSLNFIIYVAL